MAARARLVGEHGERFEEAARPRARAGPCRKAGGRSSRARGRRRAASPARARAPAASRRARSSPRDRPRFECAETSPASARKAWSTSPDSAPAVAGGGEGGHGVEEGAALECDEAVDQAVGAPGPRRKARGFVADRGKLRGQPPRIAEALREQRGGARVPEALGVVGRGVGGDRLAVLRELLLAIAARLRRCAPRAARSRPGRRSRRSPRTRCAPRAPARRPPRCARGRRRIRRA